MVKPGFYHGKIQPRWMVHTPAIFDTVVLLLSGNVFEMVYQTHAISIAQAMPKVTYTNWSHLLFCLENNRDPLYLSLTPKFTPKGTFEHIKACIIYQSCPVEEQVFHIDLMD